MTPANAATDSHSTGPRVTSVYVVDDHEMVLANLVRLIDDAPATMVIGQSMDAPLAVGEIESLLPDVAVVDGFLGGYDGLALCREVKAVAPGVACVIVTTGVGGRWAPREAVDAGVAAIVLKQVRGFDLLDAIAQQAAISRTEA